MQLWRAVAPATVRPAVRRIVQKLNFGWMACDGPSHLWRSVLPFRYEVQRVDFSNQFSDFLSVLKLDPATVRRGVRRFYQFFQNWSLLLKTTKQVVTERERERRRERNDASIMKVDSRKWSISYEYKKAYTQNEKKYPFNPFICKRTKLNIVWVLQRSITIDQ